MNTIIIVEGGGGGGLRFGCVDLGSLITPMRQTTSKLRDFIILCLDNILDYHLRTFYSLEYIGINTMIRRI